MPAGSQRFPRSHRLGGRRAFAAVYDARVRESAGPLTLYALPNQLGHARIGLSISRKVGTAVRRNRIKRLLREAYRLNAPALASGFDWVFVVRPHAPLDLDQYVQLLCKLSRRLEEAWRRRNAASPAAGGGP